MCRKFGNLDRRSLVQGCMGTEQLKAAILQFKIQKPELNTIVINDNQPPNRLWKSLIRYTTYASSTKYACKQVAVSGIQAIRLYCQATIVASHHEQSPLSISRLIKTFSREACHMIWAYEVLSARLLTITGHQRVIIFDCSARMQNFPPSKAGNASLHYPGLCYQCPQDKK